MGVVSNNKLQVMRYNRVFLVITDCVTCEFDNICSEVDHQSL